MRKVPKGNGKTPLASWIAAYDLCHGDSPVIPVAAASYEQAELLFGDLRTCVSESPTLGAWLEPFEHEVQRRDGPGRAYKVAAVAGTNDGARPSLFLADEVHEWNGPKARVHLVLSNGTAKRAGSMVLSITTAGVAKEGLAWDLHEYGQRVNAGEINDPDFLFVYYSAADIYDLADPARLETAVRAANPAAGSFLRVQDVLARYHQVPRYEFERYHLCRWTSVAESWLPPDAWNECEQVRPIPDGAEVCLGFDGSYSGDSTALVAVQLGEVPHVVVVEAWERPPNARQDWQVPIIDVEEMIRKACRRYQVREIACDPFRWARSLQILEDEGLPIVAFPQSPSRMTPATSRFYEAVMNGALTHDGDARLSRHVANCTLKVDARGARLSKDARNSPRKIDLAVSAVMAFDRACTLGPDRPPMVWDLGEVIERLRREDAEKAREQDGKPAEAEAERQREQELPGGMRIIPLSEMPVYQGSRWFW